MLIKIFQKHFPDAYDILTHVNIISYSKLQWWWVQHSWTNYSKRNRKSSHKSFHKLSAHVQFSTKFYVETTSKVGICKCSSHHFHLTKYSKKKFISKFFMFCRYDEFEKCRNTHSSKKIILYLRNGEKNTTPYL